MDAFLLELMAFLSLRCAAGRDLTRLVVDDVMMLMLIDLSACRLDSRTLFHHHHHRRRCRCRCRLWPFDPDG